MILFAECGDSFSWNLVEALPFRRGDVEVVPARRLAAVPSLLARCRALVLGPGPTDPDRAGLLPLVSAAAALRLPTLGVCLGHQAIGLAFGSRVRRVTPRHGATSTVAFTPSRLFPGVEGPLEAMRYHSLALDGVSAPLRVIAEAEGLPMAVEHEGLPIAGVQFHPDSHATPRGRDVLAAFFRAAGVLATARPAAIRTPPPIPTVIPRPLAPGAAIRLSAVAALPSFALLGPGFTGGSWRLLTELVPAAGALDVVLAGFEERSAATWRAAARHDGPLTADVAPARSRASLDERGHRDGVERIRGSIAAGDVYQVNLTLRARLPPVDGAALLAAAIADGAPPFAAWVRLPDGTELVSASPEALLAIDGDAVRSEPMKGTGRDASRLAASAKDAAELAMITDLVRNDLTPVCAPGSVRVTAARTLVQLPYAVQTVARVEGRLAAGTGPLDALAALHPGGSVTGAPKEAAVDAIRRLEPTPRGFYCGALGHGERGRFAASLLIRTATRDASGWSYGVGGGIVYDSDPAAELDEARQKLEALCRTPPCA